MSAPRTTIGQLKERYAILVTAMDELSKVQESIAKQRDQIAKQLEDLRMEITHAVGDTVAPEKLITMEIEDIH